MRAISKRFRRGDEELAVIEHLSLDVAEGEFLSLLGPSGCGKSTLLRLILGLDRSFSGDITIGEEHSDRVTRKAGIVFQEPRLLPWLTVKKNIMFGLRDLSRADASRRAQHYIELVGLAGFEDAYPKELSGGMAQRASLARTLARQPEVLLLDEPFGALDALTRMRLQDALLELWMHHRVTVLLVTHDIDEALYLSDRVAVLSNRPAQVKRIVTVQAARPRRRSDAYLASLRGEIMNELDVIG